MDHLEPSVRGFQQYSDLATVLHGLLTPSMAHEAHLHYSNRDTLWSTGGRPFSRVVVCIIPYRMTGGHNFRRYGAYGGAHRLGEQLTLLNGTLLDLLMYLFRPPLND